MTGNYYYRYVLLMARILSISPTGERGAPNLRMGGLATSCSLAANAAQRHTMAGLSFAGAACVTCSAAGSAGVTYLP